MSDGRKERLLELLRKYRVQKHYRASTEARSTRYAVYDDGGQLTEPKRYAEAKAEADLMLVEDILGEFR